MSFASKRGKGWWAKRARAWHSAAGSRLWKGHAWRKLPAERPKSLLLTDSTSTLMSLVVSPQASNSTAGHVGTAWARYSISPNLNGVWPASVQPAPYRTGKLPKSAVRMTDDMYNAEYCNGVRDDAVKIARSPEIVGDAGPPGRFHAARSSSGPRLVHIVMTLMVASRSPTRARTCGWGDTRRCNM